MVELGKHGIRVNTINPVVTLTPMAVKVWRDGAKAAGMLSRVPLQRFATPEDVANVIVWLLGPQSAMVQRRLPAHRRWLPRLLTPPPAPHRPHRPGLEGPQTSFSSRLCPRRTA